MTASATPDATAALSHEARAKRAIWRASHRGTKEMDILFGRFAQAAVPAMSPEALTAFEALLALPDPDLHRWIIEPGAIAPRDTAEQIAAIRRFHGLPA